MSYSCGICFSEYSDDERSRYAPRILRCGHTFCSECLIRILETTNRLVCPKCRRDATDMKQIPLNKALIQLITKDKAKRVAERVKALPGVEEENEKEEDKKPNKIYKCNFPGCKEVFTSKESFTRHVKVKDHSYSPSYKSHEKMKSNPDF